MGQNKMEDMFKSSLIKGLVFSGQDKFGPQPIYTFPQIVKEEDLEDDGPFQDNLLSLGLRDYIQISIKITFFTIIFIKC